MAIGKTASSVPTPRAEGLLIQPVGAEAVVYDLETKQAHCLKPLAAFVMQACDGETTIGDIAELAQSALNRPVSEADVIDAVAELEQTNLLETPLLVLDSGTGVSRRDMMRHMAYAGAAATAAGAMITTIAAPAAAAVISCTNQPQGCNCTKTVPNGNLVQVNTLCASGHCCGGVGNERCNIGCCTSTNNGNLCDCNNGTCQAVPQPVNPADCCNGVCTPSVAGSAC